MTNPYLFFDTATIHFTLLPPLLYAQVYQGGAVSFDGGRARFMRCLFTSNTCTEIMNWGFGGALDVRDCDLVDSTLTSNSATLGGALHATADVKVQNCTLEANSAKNGGAMFAAGTLSIEASSVIRNCFALGNGAAVYSLASTEITESSIQSFASQGNPDSALYHGAASSDEGVLFVRNVKFESVGLLYIESLVPSTVVVSGCDMNASDLQLTSLISCAILQGVENADYYCGSDYCTDAAVGIEVNK